MGCVTPRVGLRCNPATRCSAAGPTVSCVGGRCTQQCSPAASCGSGFVCSGPDAGTCVTDCADAGACDSDRVCAPLFYGGRSGCVPDAGRPSACVGFEGVATCDVCDEWHWTTTCPSGSRCPMDSTCNSNGTCSCRTGFRAKACGGAACTGQCAFPGWGCLADVPAAVSCPTSAPASSGTCACRDGRRLAERCWTTESCEARCAVGCDVKAQDCPAGQRCTATEEDGGLYPRCTPLQGARGLDQTCSRAGDALSDFGRDDCASGLFCTRAPAPQNEYVCRPLCRGSADCVSSESCGFMFDSRPPLGLCLNAGCALFSSSCGAGKTCTIQTGVLMEPSFTSCRFLGPSPEGAPCSSDKGCGEGLVCRSGRCVTQCDRTHGCGDAGTCLMARGLDAGVCF